MNQISILLYSEYSVNSKRILDIINNPSVKHIFSNLEKVCVDNELIRKKVLNSKKIQITKVPCILLIYQDGGVDKYDGSNAFTCVEDIIKQNSDNISNVNTLNTNTNNHSINNLQTNIDIPAENIENSPDETNDVGFTPIDNLKSDDDEVDSPKPIRKTGINKTHVTDTQPPNKPLKSIRTDVGNYELKSEFGDDNTFDDRNVTSGLKNTTTKDKSLIAVAQAMQKARESELPDIKNEI